MVGTNSTLVKQDSGEHQFLQTFWIDLIATANTRSPWKIEVWAAEDK